jgi:hypothetical protein
LFRVELDGLFIVGRCFPKSVSAQLDITPDEKDFPIAVNIIDSPGQIGQMTCARANISYLMATAELAFFSEKIEDGLGVAWAVVDGVVCPTA